MKINKSIIFLTIISLLFLVPYYWTVVVSLEPTERAINLKFHLIPENMTFENYERLFNATYFYKWLFNSLFVSTTAVILVCFTASMAGYVLARNKLPYSRTIFMGLLVSMSIPNNVLLLPRFIFMRKAGLINTYPSLFLIIIAGAGGVFLMKQFIQTLPETYFESARIDGASEWQIYTYIVLPLIKPGLVALGIFTFIGTYNDYFWQMLMLSSEPMKTLPLAIESFATKNPLLGNQLQLKMAGAVIASMPLIILFIVFHKNFISGLRIGGVKG